MKHIRLFEEYSSDYSKFIKQIDFWNIGYKNIVPFSNLKDEIIHDIIINYQKDAILIIIEGQGEYLLYEMSHEQDCYETFSLEDIEGDINDLIGEAITQADESCEVATNVADSGTWTFYKLATIKGYVTIRFIGESNGYYSERADFYQGSRTIGSYEELQEFYKNMI